jgi:hypothetical protein
MGYTRWSSDAYSHLKSTYTDKSSDEIFSNGMNSVMNPHGLVFRESRDSLAHPNSLAIAVFLDVTGSMGEIPEMLIRHKLGSLMDTLLAHGVEDPQVMFSAIGDHYTDQAPLQVGQFESGAEEMNECLSKVYIEGGGGGQNMESYLLAWLIAGRHTSIDCFEKRGRKGFLFTIGDEKNWDSIAASRLKDLMGYTQTDPITDTQVLAQAQRMYHVFHIHINETGYKDNPEVISYWKKMLGERTLILDNHRALAELIATTVAVINGANLDKIAAEFDTATAFSIKNALMKVDTAVRKTGIDSGVMKL